MDQCIGKLLDNRYEILDVVGVGGMAKVYRARDHRLNRLVAIKILREDLAQDAEFRRRFHDESQAVAMLSHPNIVAIYDVSRSSELEYIVMELIDGITLKQYMQKKGSKLNWREALHFTIQIVKALGHAHSRGIIHRDIKPHNVMVLRDGSVKVADFGIARLASGGHSTLTQEALGSVHYISPEQARGSHIDTRSDLYSAGVVLYEMITGRLPFEGDNPVSVAIQHINSIPLSPREIDPSIPEALEAITMKAMAPNPDDRYPTADDMLADLEEFRKNPNINFEYSAPELLSEGLDEDRTMIRAAAPSYDREVRRAGGERRQRRYEPEEEERRGGSPWFMVVAVVAVLAFLMGVVYILYQTVLSGIFSPPETYSVPTVTGKVYEEIADDAGLLGRFTLTLGETVENSAPAGTILSQNPQGGTQVGSAVTEITVSISAGPKALFMPDLYDKEYAEAFLILQDMGLSVASPEYSFHETVEMGHVISFTPLAGIPVTEGTKVEMVVSRGPETKRFPMPSLLEMPLENALNNIETMKLKPGEVREVFHDTIPEGAVVYQYPAVDTEVEEGTQVNLQVSKGPDSESQPPTVDPSEDNTPEGMEYVHIVLPESERTVRLMVMMDGSVIWDETYDTLMTVSEDVPVRGKWGATKTVTWFFNGILSGSQDVVIKPRV